MIRLYILFFVIALLCQQAFSQNKKVKFGEPTLEELQMQVYSGDSTAEAVVLFDIGKFTDRDISFSRHIRLKILKKSGLSWANWTFNTPFKSNFKVEVNSYENGEIINNKANSDNIFEEEVLDNFSIYKVFAPKVKVGSIIDIQYNHIGLPTEWWFQNRIPVAYNELKLEESALIKYSKSFLGFETINQIDYNHWITEDMPAFQVEPHLSTYKNYITKFRFQLTSVRNYTFSTSWDRIVNVLSEDSRFGSVLNGARFLNDMAKNIEENTTSTKEKIKAAYDSIQANIKWNGRETILASTFYKNNFKKDHNGNSADINLLLVALLNKLDIRTLPVLLSTRDNGFLLEFHPSINQLNYVIAYVKHNNVEMLIDATELNGFPGFLPERCLNGRGLIYYKDATLWVDLQKDQSDQKAFTIITIEEDGTAKAVMNVRHDGYDYTNWINEFESHDENEQLYVHEVSQSFDDVKIDNYQLIDRDRRMLSSSEKFEIDISDQLISTGNGYILTPFQLNEYIKNPFKSEERKYPVDMKYARKLSSTVNVILPNGFQSKSIPESIKLSMPEGGAVFTLLANGAGNTIQLKMNLDIDQFLYSEDQYPELKRFFGEVSRLISQPIEIEKI